MERKEIITYIEKYLADQATAAESAIVEDWYLSFESNPGLTEQLSAGEKEDALNKSLAAVKASLGL